MSRSVRRNDLVEDHESEISRVKFATWTEPIDADSDALSTGDDASDASDDETFTDLNDFPRVNRKGAIWNRYKPIKQDSLYSKILTQTRDIESAAQELCFLLERNAPEAIASLLQLCVDICGFEKFNIMGIYRAKKDAEKTLTEFVKELEDDEEYLQAACHTPERYLLMESSSILVKYLKLGIYTFLDDLVLMAHRNGMLEKLIDFFYFINHMAIHHLRVICHTGIVFCVKVLSALVKIYIRTENDEDTDEPNTTFHLIQYLYATFLKSLNFDRRSHGARVEASREIYIWGKCLPETFIGEWDIQHHILKYIHDPCQQVRLTALKTVQKLLSDQETAPYFFRKDIQERTKKLVERIAGRFVDVNEKVVVEAVRTFAILQEVRGEEYLNLDRVEELVKMIFENTFVIAQAACEFIYKYFSRSVGGATDKVLNSLALVALKHPCGFELLVEGCLRVVPDIRNWSLYIALLSEKRETLNLQNLARLFAETVRQALKGCSSMPRKGSRKVKVDPAEHDKVAQYFPELIILISDILEDEAVVIEIFKIFSVVKPAANHDEDYVVLCKFIELLFADAHDKMLLKEMVSTLNNLCDNLSFCDRAKTVKKSVVEKCSEQFCVFLNEPNVDDSLIVYKAMVLYQDGKLTDVITWSLLFDATSKFEGQVLIDLLICCKWYLIWALKKLREIKTDKMVAERHSYNLLQSIKEYTALLFSLLKNLEDDTLRLKIYQCTCEFYTRWNDTLRPLIRFDAEYKKLLLTDEPNMKTILAPFLEKYIIRNTEVPLRDRQEGIIAYIEMVNNGTIPLSSLIHVYKYYDECSVDYGKIIEASLKALWELSEKRSFYSIIIATIGAVYYTIIEKYGIIDMNINEVKALKILTKRFLTTEPFRKPNKDFIKLVMFSVQYSIKTPENLNFLFFAQYFLQLVTEGAELKHMLETLKSKLPKDQQKSDAVICFMKHAKDVLNKVRKTTTVRDSTGAKDGEGINIVSTIFESPGRPIVESTPKTPSVTKRKTKGTTTADKKGTPAVRKQRVSKETPRGRPKKKVGETSRPVYSKASVGEIDIQDDSDSNPEQK